MYQTLPTQYPIFVEEEEGEEEEIPLLNRYNALFLGGIVHEDVDDTVILSERGRTNNAPLATGRQRD